MQIVELKVQVEKSQLAALESQVKALNGKTVNIKVNTSGLDTKALNALANYNKGLAANQKAKAQVVAANAKIVESNNKVRIAQEKTAQAQFAVTKEMNRTTQSFNKVRQETEKTTQSYNKAAQEQIKYQRQMEKGTQAQSRSTRAMAESAKATKEASKLNQLLGGSIGEVAAKMAAWQVMGTLVSAPIRAMKEALSTMKEVDSQLVVIQKTTNFSDKQMKEIEQQAYKTASAYGQSADSYLESVSAFARAGYKEQSAQLGELAVKTQLVGDTTAEVADQFLLSVDKAYKYNGSVTELMKVLDGADYINNNYATSIEKIAEGMGIVAPVAAQAHVGVDELMAAIGTVTAVTQRSGSEAARALRALFLNIIGDTKTEIDEGVTWTTGEIAGLQDVLRKFAPDVVKTADAMGTVINPMEAMHALSQAMKEDVLNEQELMEMVSDIGGKLRTSQLLAIIQNWDMYESMLADYQTAAGTADKEIEHILGSWESKVNILKNTWTEFVSHIIDTDMIKGGLEGVTNVIEVLDSGLGQTAIKAAAFAAATAGITKAVTGIGAALKGSALLSTFLGLQGPGMTLFGRLAGGVSALAASFGPLALVLGAIAAVVAAPALVDFFTTDYKEHGENISQLKSEYEELYGAQSEFEELRKKSVSDEGLSEYEQKRLDYLKNYRDELKQNIEAEKEAAKAKYQEQYGAMAQDSLDDNYRRNGGKGITRSETIDVKMLREAKKAYEELSASLNDGTISEGEFKTGLQDIMDTYADFVSATREGLEGGWIDYDDLTEAQKGILDLYDALERLFSFDGKELRIENALADFEQSGQGITDFANQTVISAERMREALREAGVSAEDANKTIQELRDGGAIVIDVENDGIDETLSNLEELGLAKKDVEGNWDVDIGGVQDLASELGMSAEEAGKLAAALSDVDGVNVSGTVDSVNRIATSLDQLRNGTPLLFDITATDNASGTIQTVEGEKEAVSQPANTQLTATDNASPTIQSAGAEARRFGDMRPNPTLSATDRASSVIRGAVSALSGFVSKSITLTATYITSGKGPGGGGWGSGKTGLGPKAAGDIHFKGGPVLLGDELSPDGSPRPELVITKSGAYLAGTSGPVATTLPAGARIYKYSDTIDILSGGDMEELQAFKGGTGLSGLSLSQLRARGKTASANKPSSGSSASSSGSSGSKSSGSGGGSSKSSGSKSSGSKSGSSKSSGSKSSKSGSKKSGSSKSSGSNDDPLKNQLELLQAQYEFLEASNASTDDLIAKSHEIQDQLHLINDNLRATGGEEKDIWKNSTDWYKELDKIRDKQKEIFENARSLMESQTKLMRANSTADEKRLETLQAILGNLHDEAEFLRSIGADQEDINELSIEWWKVQEDIYGIFEDQRNLMETEVDLMEHQGGQVNERVAKLRQIQDNLHQQADYMRSIGARQEDINRLSIQWWEIQEQILQIQKDLQDELDAAINKELRDAQKSRDARIKLLRAEIEKIREENEVKEDSLELEEKQNKVLEARKNLLNALNERTVRYYNAKTGQWERGADQSAVKSAREAYEEAQKALEQEKKDREIDRRVKEKEDEISRIESEYERLESRWETLLSIFDEPVRDIKDILRDMYQQGMVTDAQMSAIQALVGDIDVYTASILEKLKSFSEFKQTEENSSFYDYLKYRTGSDLSGSGFSQSIVDYIEKHPETAWTYTDENGVQYSSDGTTTVLSDLGKYNPGSLRLSSGADAAKATAEYIQSVTSGIVSGGGSNSSSSSGAAAAARAAAEAAKEAASSSSGSGKSGSSGGTSRAKEAAARAAAEAAISTNKSSSSSVSDKLSASRTALDAIKKATGKAYDSGGVLSGFGGIKATAQDEIVIPPTVAKAMLQPSANRQFKSRMAELGFLYGATRSVPPSLAGMGGSRSSADHYGDTYSFGDVVLTEGQAKSTTVYQLAQMSRSLGIYNNG